ncbi:DUF6328 family protein [Ammonicoccus fulvus]|uniref:DUF6328 family protein n=1 Tax=Ammonicoccus fulvus TaxID=3138240 RepID=A0ABZ3FVN5_9ACTN
MSDGVRDPDDSTRDELPGERLDRNWNELLQEMRVIQTGIQILFGFLLTVPFQPRFVQLTQSERVMFVILLALVALSTVINLAPILAHRLVFQQRRKAWLVALANRSAIIAIALLGLALVAGLGLVINLTFGEVPGYWAAGLLAVVILLAWLVAPLRMRRHRAEER